MTWTGEVQITVVDGSAGIVSVPAATVQAVIGCAYSGTVNQVVATKNLATLQSTFGAGPLMEAAGLVLQAGGTVFAVRAATATSGAATSVTFTGTGTSAITVSGTPRDDYYVQLQVLTGGTIGTAGIVVAVSLDAGRTYGPSIALGTASNLALADSGGYNTGITINFGAGNLVAGDYARFSTTAPQPNAAGIAAALTALRQYINVAGVSGAPIVQICGDVDSTLAAAIQTDLNTDAANYFFERAVCHARDAHAPVAWGGAGETEATWRAAVIADFASANAARVAVCAGWYNMPSAFPTLFASVPVYRRPLSFALGARQVAIPPQTHAGKVGNVNGGPLTQIQVNAARDSADGFVYHDEAANVGFDYLLPGGVGRITAARLRARRPGFYISNPLTLAVAGSDFSLLPYGLVMDVACSIAHDALEQFVNADMLTNANGTLADTEAATIQGAVEDAIDQYMTNVSMISGRAVAVDQTQNINVTKKLAVTITIQGRAYILEVDVTLGFANNLAAAAG